MDLFSGIGGMTLALQHISSPIMYCDKCPHARRILTKNMDLELLPRAPILHDVHEVLNTEITGGVDLITAGFPCTGFSVAGRHEAFANADTALFHVLLDIVATVQPALVFLENTPSITIPHHLSVVQHAFSKLSYNLDHCLLPAFAAGLPHHRVRWFAVASRQKVVPHVVFPPLLPSLVPPPRTVSDPPLNPTVRFNLLKNALVPSCARMALQHLLTKDPLQYTKPNLALTIEQGPIVITKHLWPTLFGHYRLGAHSLTERCSRDIITAIKHERQSTPGHVNFAFLEWLMGFPEQWTA